VTVSSCIWHKLLSGELSNDGDVGWDGGTMYSKLDSLSVGDIGMCGVVLVCI
jgi:hypothetical protein